MTLNLAQRVLNQESLSKDEAISIFENAEIDTFDLLNEAYTVRKHYYGKKVKLNMILNAKSGICAEDCGYCGQSVKMKENNVMHLLNRTKLKKVLKWPLKIKSVHIVSL